MISRESLEFYRKMSPSERLRLSIELSNESLKYLFMGPQDVVDRRFARIRQQKDLFAERVCAALAAHAASCQRSEAANVAEQSG